MPEEQENDHALDVPRKSLEEIEPGLLQMLQAVFTAARNVHMYPPDSPAAIRLVEAAYNAIAPTIAPEGCMDVSFIEDKMVINGETVDEALQKRGIIKNFHDILKVKKVSSITFWSGVTREELQQFLVMLTSKQSLDEAGEQIEFHLLMEEEGIKHIEIDEQIYVAISKREKVVDARAVTEQESDPAIRALRDEVFARFLAGEVIPGEVSSDAVHEMMVEPEKMIAAVQSFVEAHGWGGDARALPLNVEETHGILERMVVLLSGVDDPNLRNKLSREVERIARQIEVPELKEILFTGGGGDGGAALPAALLPLLADEKVSALLDEMAGEYGLLEQSEEGSDWPSERLESARTVLEQAASTRPEWARKIAGMYAGAGGGPAWKQRETDEIYSTELARTLESGADMSVCDMAKGPVLVNTAWHLAEDGRDDLVPPVIEKVRARFRNQPPGPRLVAARQVDDLARKLRELGKEELLGGFDKEVGEVVLEADSSRRNLAEFSSMTVKVGDGGPIEGMYVPDTAVSRLMSSDTGKVVQAVFTSDDPAAREAVTRALLQMPDRAIPALLDTAQEATDTETVSGIAESLREFKDTTPWITSRLGKEMEPWQRANLVRLFGMVASPESARALEPMLQSPEQEPHVAAINALVALGGKTALQMLLDESLLQDPMFQVPALRALGKFHDYQAVRRLTVLITPGKKGEMLGSDQALVAACRSLGDMHAVPAAELISDIALARKHIRASDEVRAAAVLALGKIGGAGAHEVIKKLSRDPSMLVRSTARRALGQ
ncbi:MAG: HEAT repeat domain-containing protein [Candidatus Geothermincolia bacterium]